MLQGELLDGKVVYVTPVRHPEGRTRSRYNKNWHQDWYEQSEIPEWVKLVSGWKDNKYLLDGEEPLPVPVTFKADFTNRCIEVVGSISWNNLPAGTYHGICGRDSRGELLWEISFPWPIQVNPGGTLCVNNIGMRCS